MAKVRIEPRGSVLLGGALALTSAGLLTVDGVLMSLGVAAGLLLGMAWCLGRWNVVGLDPVVDLPAVGQAGGSLRLRVEVENSRALMDGFGLDWEIEAPGGFELSFEIPWLAAGSGLSDDLRELVPERGWGEKVGCRLESGFPLGLFRFSKGWEKEHSMVVLPRPILPGELVLTGRLPELEALVSAGGGETIGEPRGLREFRAGDRAASIAWAPSIRSNARGGALLAWEPDPPGCAPSRVVVLFHSHSGGRSLIQPDHFEVAISLVWGALRHLQERGVPVVMLADFEEWVPRRIVTMRQLGQAGEVLARARRAGGTEAHELEARLMDLEEEDALVVVSDMPKSGWRELLGERKAVLVDAQGNERRGNG